MRCPRCGTDVEKGWAFCPRCGYRLHRADDFFSGTSGFDDILQRLVKQISDEMNRMLERNVEVFDLSPLFSSKNFRGRSRGFRIKITRSGNEKPRIDVKTFGNVDRDAIRDEIEDVYEKAGVKKGMESRLPIGARPVAEARSRAAKEPAVTEEPETTIRRDNSSVIVEVRVPGVKSINDIDVTELDKSVEVKAIVGSKAYFKILTKPPSYSLKAREFRDGVLKLVFS